MKNSDGRQITVGTCAAILGTTVTNVGYLVSTGKLSRHGERGRFRFDVVEVLALLAVRAKRGVHCGRPTQRESMTGAIRALAPSRQRRMVGA